MNPPRENNSYKICHLSLLNPALHSRIFFKEGKSLKAAGYNVSIIAPDPGSQPYEYEGIRIVPFRNVGRKIFSRMKAWKEIIAPALEEKADVYHLHSPELFQAALAIRQSLKKVKIIYDVHEDYQKNILFGGYYPGLIKKKLAAWTRKREQKLAKLCDGIIYSEKCFQGLLDNENSNTITIENKFKAPRGMEAPSFPRMDGPPTLTHTGTLAGNWGIFRAVDLWKRINKIIPVRLLIAGHTHDPEVISNLLNLVKKTNIRQLFELRGGQNYLPFPEVVQSIMESQFGLALYVPTENIKDRIPTKFFEFMAYKKPMIYSANSPWEEFHNAYSSGVSLNWPPTDAEIFSLAEKIQKPSDHFYNLTPPREFWSWETEERKLIAFYKGILNE